MTKELHVNRYLTDLAIQYRPAGLVGDVLFPVYPVNNKSDDFPVYSKPDRFTIPDTLLGPKAEANEVDWGVSSDSYACANHALKDFVPNEDKANADAPIRPEMDTVEFLQDLISLGREKRIADKCAALANSHTPTTKWDAEGATIIQDVETTKALCFVQPNVMVIPEGVFNVMKWDSNIVEAIKYVGIGKVTTEHLQELFEVEKVVIAKSKMNTAKRGKTPVYASVWGNNVVLAYVNPRNALRDVTFGKTFAWKFAAAGGKVWSVRSWEEPKRGLGGGVEIQVESSTDEKLVCADCGAVCATVLTQ